jgi:uncharacterized protein (DUF58 family)
VTTTDPFGLFRHRRVLPGEQEVVVYPATVELPYLGLSMGGAPEDGRRRRPVHHPTPHAASVREHLPSDSISRIHWPTTARMGKLFVKQFDQGTGNDAWLLVDLQAAVQAGSGPDSTDECAVTAAASVAQRYLNARVPVGLLASGSEAVQIPAEQSPGQLGRILDGLARVKADGRTPVAELLLSAQRLLLRNSTVMVITPSGDPTWVMALASLLPRGTRATTVLLDPASFGGTGRIEKVLEQLLALRTPTFVVRQGQALGEALSLAWQAPAPVASSVATLQTREGP